LHFPLVNVWLDPFANFDLEVAQMLAKVSTKYQAWAREQVRKKVPLSCPGPRVLQVLVLQSEKLMGQAMSVFARVWEALQ
jgi:hypothetical protein